MMLMTFVRRLILAAGKRQLAPLDEVVLVEGVREWDRFRRVFPAVSPSRVGELAERWGTRWAVRGKIPGPKKCRAGECPARLTKDVRGRWVKVYCTICEMKAIRTELAKLNCTVDPSDF
jgi:hypothetical protein